MIFSFASNFNHQIQTANNLCAILMLFVEFTKK